MPQLPRRVAQLALVGISTALIYAAALLRFPLLQIYAQPIQNLQKLTNASAAAGVTLAACVLLLFAAYGTGALVLARAVPPGGAAPRGSWPLTLIIAGFPLVFLALLLLVYPLTSVDLYDYLFRGRMQVRYGANTFIQIPRNFEHDPLFWYVAWRRAVTAYGPLWEGMSRLTAWLAGERLVPPGLEAARDAELLRLMLAYKGLAALGFLLCGAAIWGALGRIAPEQRWLGLYLWLWNPLALWESIGAGHNDSWMALLIVLAVWTLSARRGEGERGRDSVSPSPPLPLFRPLGAFLGLTVGGLIKYLALFFGPMFLSAALRRLPTPRERLRLILYGAIVCGAAVVIAYAPFWEGWGTLRNFGDRGTLFTASWLAVLQSLLATFLEGGTAEALAASVGIWLLGCGITWSAVRGWRAPHNVAQHALWLVLWFLFFCNPWFQPWYLLWVLALIALQPWRGRITWSVGLFCCTAMLSYGADVFLLTRLGWDTDNVVLNAIWNAILSVLIYGPPLLALGWGRKLDLPGLWRRARELPQALRAADKHDAVA
jgi:hypothetical protein